MWVYVTAASCLPLGVYLSTNCTQHNQSPWVHTHKKYTCTHDVIALGRVLKITCFEREITMSRKKTYFHPQQGNYDDICVCSIYKGFSLVPEAIIRGHCKWRETKRNILSNLPFTPPLMHYHRWKGPAFVFELTQCTFQIRSTWYSKYFSLLGILHRGGCQVTCAIVMQQPLVEQRNINCFQEQYTNHMWPARKTRI